VAQQQLDLLKLAATGAAYFGARAAEIVWGYARDSGCFCIGLDELPDYFFTQPVARHPVSAIH